MQRNGIAALTFHSFFILFLLAPLIPVLLVSLTPHGYLSYPTTSLSLRWFEAILDSPGFINAFWTSLYLGFIAATVSTLLALPAGLGLTRYSFPGRGFFVGVFLSPLMIPAIVLGVAFLRFFSQIGIGGTFLSLVIAHCLFVMPFTLRLILASAMGLDTSVERAAYSLGASNFAVFRRITLPLILPGVIGGWILAFITSFDELSMTIFVASPQTTTLPVKMYNYIAQTVDPLVTAISALLIVGTLVAMLIIDRIFGLERLLVGRT